MGNCFSNSNKSTSEIAPFDFIRSNSAADVKLSGSPATAFTVYIHLALLYKKLSVQLTPNATNESQTVLQIGSDTNSGSRQMMIAFIDEKFPQPRLLMRESDGFGETTPVIVRAVILHHRSIRWHLDRMVRWVEEMAARGGKKKMVNPAMGSPRMEIRKFSKSYSQLLELMLEHAQMEERLVFPVLEMADTELCKAANEEHARDLPLMNGIKEDIKTIGVLNNGSPDYQYALRSLSTRLKSLLKRYKEHFEEEERDVLPFMEAADLSKEQQHKLLEQCLDVMQSTHSHLFNFLIEGLLPWQAMHYLDLILECKGDEAAGLMFRKIIE